MKTDNKLEVIYTENKVRAILKKPDRPPEIINVTADDIVKLFNPIGAYAGIPHDDFSSQIVMYYEGRGDYNFEIGFHRYYGNVLFVKSKYHHSCAVSNVYDMTDEEIIRLCALMKWNIGIGGDKE